MNPQLNFHPERFEVDRPEGEFRKLGPFRTELKLPIARTLREIATDNTAEYDEQLRRNFEVHDAVTPYVHSIYPTATDVYGFGAVGPHSGDPPIIDGEASGTAYQRIDQP